MKKQSYNFYKDFKAQYCYNFKQICGKISCQSFGLSVHKNVKADHKKTESVKWNFSGILFLVNKDMYQRWLKTYQRDNGSLDALLVATILNNDKKST